MFEFDISRQIKKKTQKQPIYYAYILDAYLPEKRGKQIIILTFDLGIYL